jgi:beta-glucanase (GH16 family)
MNKKLILKFLGGAFLAGQISIAQTPANDPTWVKNTPLSDDFTSLDYSGGGVFYLTNFGTPSWTVVNSSGWHGSSTRKDGATCLALSGSDLFAGTSTVAGYNGGLYKSSSGGSWSKYPYTDTHFITSCVINGSNIYVGKHGGLDYYNGTTWSELQPNSSPSTTYNYVTSIALNGSNIFAGLYGPYGGVFLYNGSTWSNVSTGLTNTFINSLVYISGSSLVVGTEGGVFYTSNNGTSWASVNGSGLTNLHVTSLILDGSTLIAGTDAGVFYSSNYSSGSPTWTSANSSGLTNAYITSLAVIASGSIVAGTNGGGVFYSTNYSSGSPIWASINGSGGGALTSLTISSLLYDGSSKLYVGVCPKWRVLDVAQNDCCGGNDPSQVSVSSGILDLQDGPNTYVYSNFTQQGTINTYNAKHGYGYYEINAKLPYCDGSSWDKFHSSFWSYYGFTDASGCGASHQEIDCFETDGSSYHGTTYGPGYWHTTSCTLSKVIQGTSYTDPSGLYSAYHKYAVDWGPNRMIFYVDDAPIYSYYNQPYFALEGLQEVQISAGLDINSMGTLTPNSPYASGDIIPAHFYVDYFYYYRLLLDCSTSKSVTNNTLGSANTLKLSGLNAYIPAVYSDIAISPPGSLTLSSSTDCWTLRAVNSITISPSGTGSFSVPAGETLLLLPTPCDN